jgi:hypothetical protein
MRSKVIRQNVSDALPWFITAVALAANHSTSKQCGWVRDLQARYT